MTASVLREGAVDALIGPDCDLRTDSDERLDEAVFGPDAAILRSQALARIHLGEAGPAGLLALGSRFPGAFDGHEAEDLVRFLGRVVEQCIRHWLEVRSAV